MLRIVIELLSVDLTGLSTIDPTDLSTIDPIDLSTIDIIELILKILLFVLTLLIVLILLIGKIKVTILYINNNMTSVYDEKLLKNLSLELNNFDGVYILLSAKVVIKL